MKKTVLSTLFAGLMALSMNGFAGEQVALDVQASTDQMVEVQAQVLNINQADADQIAQTVKGIGPAKAQAIVAFRQANGPFKSMEELTQVKGIGLKTLEKNRAVFSFD